MTDGTAALNESINRLPATVTLADAETVDRLERMYNATSADQRVFIENYAKLQNAIATVQRLRAEQGGDTPEPPAPDTPTEPAKTDGMPVYAIVLIVVGAVVVLAGVGLAVWFFVVKKRKGADAAGSEQTAASDTSDAPDHSDAASTEETKGEDNDEK